MTKQRFNLALPERSMERLEDLKAKTDASSVAEVIKNALMTYESLADYLAQGAVFFMTMPNGEQVAVDFLIDVERRKPDLRLVSVNGPARECAHPFCGDRCGDGGYPASDNSNSDDETAV